MESVNKYRKNYVLHAKDIPDQSAFPTTVCHRKVILTTPCIFANMINY